MGGQPWPDPGAVFVWTVAHHPLTDIRRKRILYRATHRGTKESDAVVGGFFRQNISEIPNEKLDEADELLDVADADLMDWFMGRIPVPDRWVGTLFDCVLAYYRSLAER